MTVMASAIVCGPMSAHAMNKEDYWTGFYTGVAASVCSLNKEGLISRDYAKLFLQEIFKKDPDIPASSREFVLKDSGARFKDCPFPQ